MIVAVTPHGRADAVCHIADDNQQLYFVLPAERQMLMTDFLEHLADKNQQQHQAKQDHQQHQTDCQDQSSHQDYSNQGKHRNTQQSQQEVMYIQQQNGNFTTDFPELASDIDSDLPWASEAFDAKPDAVNLWIGNDQSVTSFHKDHYENLYAVITGEKTFTLLPPCDVHRMHLAHYPVAVFKDSPDGLITPPVTDMPGLLWSPIEDLANTPSSEQQRQRFPRYFDDDLPKPLRVTVKAGEVLYLPSLWWHQVEQKADSEGLVIAVNYWYDMSFDCKYAYFKMAEALSVPGLNAQQQDNEHLDGNK